MDALQGNDFPPDYSERIAKVCQHCAEGLSAVHGDLLAQLRIVCRYFQEGEEQGISHGALIDFLGVSTPSVLAKAGYRDAEGLDLMKALTLIRNDEQGRPQPPSALPPPPPEEPKAEQGQLGL